MKLSVSRAIVMYWNEIRGLDPAPTRAALKPGSISNLLPDLFILQRDNDGASTFRLAGTRVCALMGRELRGQSFYSLFPPEQLQKARMLFNGVTDSLRPAAVELSGQPAEFESLDLEMILLPLIEHDRDARLALGVLAPVDRNPGQILLPLDLLRIDHIDPIRPQIGHGLANAYLDGDGGLYGVLKKLSSLGSKNREKPVT